MSKQVFTLSTHTIVNPFERISSDVWGPCSVVSVEGYEYYVSFVDENTRFTWIFPLMYKSQVFFVFEKFYDFIMNHF